MIQPPDLIVAADWGVGWGKRWMACAVREEDGSYTISHPVPIGESEKFLQRLRPLLPKGGTALVGFDFPIGLPSAYAGRQFPDRGFREILKTLVEGIKTDKPSDFFTPTNSPCRARPFGPSSPQKDFGPKEASQAPGT
jgi:hypothetical protein